MNFTPSELRAAALAALLLVASCAALAQEPDLRLTKAAPADLAVDVIPSPILPVPLAWNLYRGELRDVASYQQRGDPDGRCDVPGTDSSIRLVDEMLLPGAQYYLLAAVPSPGTETGLGQRSDGMPRSNPYPCPSACGTEVIPTASIIGTEGVAIAPDGTLYYSQRGAVGRRRPGAAQEDGWVALTGANTVWGLALRDDGILFVGSPTTASVYRIDTTQAIPSAIVLLAAAGGPNGLTIGPDRAVYYSDFGGGRVYRVDDAGARRQVTASAITQANGVLFDDDGTLLVVSYATGDIYRLTLDASMAEASRVVAGSVAGALDGIAKDATGRFYLSDNGGRRLVRTNASFGSQEILLTGVGAPATTPFGKGALDCTDIYVASSGALGFYESDAGGRP